MMLTWKQLHGQYVAIKACTCMYMDETGHISNFFSNKPHSNSYLKGKIRVEKGKGKWKLYVYLGYYLSE